KGQAPAGLGTRLAGHRFYSSQKESNPAGPVAVGPYPLKPVVVLSPVLLEVGGEIQQWLRQATTLDEKQRDEEAPDAAVAVEERMDRLELLVHQRALNEIRGPAAILKEPFPCAAQPHEMVGRRRHVDGGRHRAPRRA